MKKKLLAAVTMLTLLCTANAQTPETTVASVDPYPGYTKTSAFVQYGYAPITSFNGWTSNLFHPFAGHTPEPEVDNLSMGLGAITAGVTINLNQWLELAIPLTYSRTTGNYQNIAPCENNSGFVDNWFSLTPNVKFNWYNSKSGKVSLYSRVGIGIATGSRKIPDTSTGTHLDTKVAFAFIASPIGIEVGRNIAYFAEVGVGQTGCISMGVRFRFKKSKEGYNDDGSIKHHNWYDRYLDKK